MKWIPTKIETGHVNSFDQETLKGIVIAGGKEWVFYSTSFISTSTAQAPTVGTHVDVVTTLDRLVCVYGK